MKVHKAYGFTFFLVSMIVLGWFRPAAVEALFVHPFSKDDVTQIRLLCESTQPNSLQNTPVMRVYMKRVPEMTKTWFIGNKGFAHVAGFEFLPHYQDCGKPCRESLYKEFLDLSELAKMIKNGEITAFAYDSDVNVSIKGDIYFQGEEKKVSITGSIGGPPPANFVPDHLEVFLPIRGFYFLPIVASEAAPTPTTHPAQGIPTGPTRTPDKPKMSFPTTRISMEPDTDRPGMDYKNFWMDQPCPECCRDACADDPNCKAYTYVKPRRPGEKAGCFLKQAVPPAKKNNCCISGAKGKR